MSISGKVDKAIAVIREYAEEAEFLGGKRGFRVGFSGGKDSLVVKKLTSMAGVVHHAEYNNTTIDPPELTHFIRKHHPDVTKVNPAVGFFRRLPQRIPPTRGRRWCCEEYKERGGRHLVNILGIRAAESKGRKRWSMYGPALRSGAMCLLPILEWSEADVWEFIHRECLPYCSLYDEGFSRLGCVGCPMAGCKQQRREFDRWPRFEVAWRASIYRWWHNHQDKLRRDGKPYALAKFDDPEQLWQWWVSGGRKSTTS